MPGPRTTHHTVVALVEDRPGVLNRVSSLFRRRGFNIESLAVGHSEVPGVSRMTIVVDGANTVVDQVEKQLFKLIDVIRVDDITQRPLVARELALIKVRCDFQTRSDIIQLAQVFRVDVVDVGDTSVVIQITGEEDKVDAFVQLMEPYGVIEMVRTGRVALVRGGEATTVEEEVEPEDVREFHSRSGRRPEAEGALPFKSD